MMPRPQKPQHRVGPSRRPPPDDDDEDDEGRRHHHEEARPVLVHPMVPVPDAILCVLREASRIAALALAATGAADTLLELVSLYEGKDDAARTRRRTAAHDVVVPPPGYPPHRASVMDGYAISTSSYPKDEPSSRGASQHRRFLVAGKVHAGGGNRLDGDDDDDDDNNDGDDGPAPASTGMGVGATPASHDDAPPPLLVPSACYVTTGAVVPDAFDCVVPLEDVAVVTEGGDLSTSNTSSPSTSTVIELLDTADVRPGRWIRAVGFDLPAGTVALRAGQELDATAVGLLRQAGRSYVEVLPRVRIGVLSTGNEIRDDPRWSQPTIDGGSPLGTIPDVNRPVLMNLYKSWNNCDVIDLGIVRDSDDAAIRDALVSAVDVHDCQVVVTTGGISVGEMDRMEPVLKSLDATLHFGRLHMKPGKPTTLATIRDNRMVFCLPGNPVSAIVCSHLLVRPCLDLLYQAPLVLLRHAEQGEESPTFESSEDLQRRLTEELAVLHPEVPVVMQNDVLLDAERPEYHRVRLRPVVDAASGTCLFEAHSTGVQQSSRLASMSGAHAVVLLPQATPQQRTIAKGTIVRALLFDDGGGIFPRLTLDESLHMKEGTTGSREDSSRTVRGADASTKRVLSVDVVLVRCAKPNKFESGRPDASEVTQQVQQALGSGPSSPFRVVSNRAYTYQGDMFSPPTVWEEAILGGGERSVEGADVQIVAYEGPMVQQLQLASFLKAVLSKLAPALEMDARQGIATESCTAAALFDVVVGVVDSSSQVSVMSAAGDRAVVRDADEGELPNPSKRRRVFLLLPAAGLTGALMATRRQIRHAVKISQQSG